MRWDIVKTLFHFHLHYTNAQIVKKLRKDYANISNKLIQKYNKYKLLRVLGSCFIGFFISTITHGALAGIVAFFILLFSFLTLNDNVYSLFYESKDSFMLLNLPIHPKELFVAKMLLLMESLIEIFAILFSYLLTALLLYQPFSIVQLLYYFIICILLALFSLFVSVLLNSLIVQTRFFRKNIILFRSIKTILISLLSCSGYILNHFHLSFIQFSDPLLSLFKPSSFLAYLINTIILLILDSVLYSLIHYYFSVQYLKNMQELKPERQKKKKQSKSLIYLLIQRNINLLKNQTVISTALAPSISYFVILFLNTRFIGSVFVSHPEYYIYSYIIVFMLALTFVSESGFCAVSQSLEQEQWLYIKVLPIDINQYLMIKFFTVSTLQIILYDIVLTIYFIVVGFNMIPAILSIILFNIIAYGKSLWMFKFDYQHLLLNCSSYADLYTRHDKLFAIVIYFLKILLLLFIIGVLIFIVNEKTYNWLTILIFLVAISYTFFAYTQTKDVFQQI